MSLFEKQQISSSPKGGRRWLIPILLAVIGVSTVLLLFEISSKESPGGRDDLSGQDNLSGQDDRNEGKQAAAVSLEPDRNPGYVGPQACAACHRERVEEFLLTNHARTCRKPMQHELTSAIFDGRNTYQPRFGGTKFQMDWVNEQLVQSTIRDTEIGRLTQKTRVDLILGAGTADDVFLAWHDDGQMFELPIAWLWPFDQWGASHFMHSAGQGDYSRQMTVRCLECHNTWIQQEPGTVNVYRRETAIHGVTCERCHGPAADHVAWHQDRPADKSPHAIVRPAELSRQSRTEVCTQCHSNSISHRKPPFTYVPGTPLDEHYLTHTIPCPEDDHVANQIDGLLQSACYLGSDQMTCVTCHDPHQKSSPAERSVSCRQCHEPAECGKRESLPEQLRDDCVRCHMPKRVKINVKFETETDNFVPPASRHRHKIAVDHVATQEVILKWLRKNPEPDPEQQAERQRLQQELTDHWMAEATKHESEDRFLAAIADLREALAIADRPEIRSELQRVVNLQEELYSRWASALADISAGRIDSAIFTLEALIAIRPIDAEYHSKLGTLYAMKGRTAEARRHLEEVIRLDSNNPSGHGVLGRIDYLAGNLESAISHWRKALELDPSNSQIAKDLAAALEKAGQSVDSTGNR